MPSSRGRQSKEASLTVVRVSDNRPPAPDSLDEDEATCWDRIVGSLPADFFRPGDLPLLEAYCVAFALWRKAVDDLKANGIYLTDDRTGRHYTNPASSLLATQASSMAQLSVKLRLSPSSRYTTKGVGTKAAKKPEAARPWSSS